MHRGSRLLAAISLVVAAGCGDDNGVGPAADLTGTWDLIGYSDHGVAATASGTVVFGEDGVFSVVGSLTYPGEAPELLDVSGTWSPTPTGVLLYTSTGSDEWTVETAGLLATLTRIEPEPQDVMQLYRRVN